MIYGTGRTIVQSPHIAIWAVRVVIIISLRLPNVKLLTDSASWKSKYGTTGPIAVSKFIYFQVKFSDLGYCMTS